MKFEFNFWATFPQPLPSWLLKLPLEHGEWENEKQEQS